MNTNIKIIVASVSLAASVSAWGAMGGLNVRSHLGEPFAGSITVSGDEAKALMEGGRLNVSGGVRGSVSKNGNGTVTVHLRSSAPVHEPVLSFTVSAGQQTRQYTALLDPPRYKPAKAKVTNEPKPKPEKPRAEVKPSAEKGVKVPINQDFIEKKKTENDTPSQTAQKEKTKTRAQDKVEKKPTAAEPQPRNAETAKVKKPTKAAVTPRRHRAYAGEKLADIAARYRPHNMSQQTAMRALVMANPRAFRHGTTVRRSVTLYIPTEAQWHVYAQRAAQQSAAANTPPARRVAPAAQRPAPQTPVAPTPPSSVAPIAPPPQDTAVPPPPPPPAPPQDTAVPPPPPPPPQEETPAPVPQPASPSASVPSGETSAATPADDTSVPSSDSASANIAVSDAASEVSAAFAPTYEQPATPAETPTAENATSEVVEEESEESDNTLMWVMAGAGTLAVGGLVAGGLLLMRRRRQADNNSDQAADDTYIEDDEYGAYPEDEDDGVEWAEDAPASTAERAKADLSRTRAEVESHSTTAAGAAAASEYVTEEDDGVFFGSDEPAQTDTASYGGDDDDWSWLEGSSSGSNSAAPKSADNGFEADDWSLDQDPADGNSFEVDDWSLEKNKAEVHPADNNQFAAGDDDFSSFGDFDDFKPDTAPAADKGSGDFNDFSDFGDFSLDTAPPAPAAPAADKGLSDFDDFGDFSLDTPPPTPAATADKGLSLDGLDDFGGFDLSEVPEAPDKTTGTPPSAIDDLDAFAQSALDDLDSFDLSETAVPAAPAHTGFDDLSFNSLDDLVLDDTPAPRAAPAAPADDLDALAEAALQDLDTFDLPAPDSIGTSTASDKAIGGFDDGLSFDDFVLPEAAAPTPTSAPAPTYDDLDALAAAALDNLDLSDIGDLPAPPPQENSSALTDLDSLDFSGLDSLVSETPPAPSHGANSLQDFVVDDTASTVAEPAPTLDNLDFSGLDDFIATEPAAPKPPANPPSAAADMDFGDFSDFDYSAPAAANHLNSNQHATDNGGLSLLDEKLAAKLADLNMADVLTPVQTPAAMPDTDNGLTDFDLNLSDDDFSHSLDNQHTDNLPAAEESWLNDSDTLHIADDDFADSSNIGADLTELENFDADWGADETPSAHTGVGFVSEAVGTEEPQEAKLELAKMYVEIEDLSAARETLGELVAESSGEVKAEAERLLAQLG